MKEIEILVQLHNVTIDQAKEKLEQHILEKEQHTIDEYYTHENITQLQPDTAGKIFSCLRIRDKGGKSYITYKDDKYKEDTWLYSDEWETVVGDSSTIKSILLKMGFVPLVLVDVIKYTYEFEPDFELVLEDVKDLGVFLEIEYKKEVPDDSVLAIKKMIEEKITSLGFLDFTEMNAGKPELLLSKRNTSRL